MDKKEQEQAEQTHLEWLKVSKEITDKLCEISRRTREEKVQKQKEELER